MPGDIEDLIEASSLGTPHAKALREEGRRLLKGGRSVIDVAAGRIGDDMAAGRIDDVEAYDQLLDAGCTPQGARAHVARWQR